MMERFEIASCFSKSMCRRCDLRLNERGSRCIHALANKVLDQIVEAVERTSVAQELQCHLLLFDDVFSNSLPFRRLPEAAPGLLACALQVDDSDIPSGR